MKSRITKKIIAVISAAVLTLMIPLTVSAKCVDLNRFTVRITANKCVNGACISVKDILKNLRLNINNRSDGECEKNGNCSKNSPETVKTNENNACPGGDCIGKPNSENRKEPEKEIKTEENKTPETTAAGEKNETAEKTNVSEYERRVVELVNNIRRGYGLGELKINSELCRLADMKSQDMKDKKYFAHQSPTYGSAFDMMKSADVAYRYAGENIAMGYRTPEAVVDAWMNSEGHRRNILNSSFTEIGIGYLESGNYWTQMFIG